MITYYRVNATGQWCGPSYENGGADPDAIAETLGLRPGSIEAVEVEQGDPRTGELLNDPNVPEPQRDAVPAPSPLVVIKDALLADPAISDVTKAAIAAISGGSEDAPTLAEG